MYSKGAGSAAGSDTTAVAEVKAFGVVGTNKTLNFTLNGVTITFPTLTGDKDADIAAILASAGATPAAASGATVNADRGYNNSGSITMSVITPAGYSAALFGERYTTQAALAAATTNTGGV